MDGYVSSTKAIMETKVFIEEQWVKIAETHCDLTCIQNTILFLNEFKTISVTNVRFNIIFQQHKLFTVFISINLVH